MGLDLRSRDTASRYQRGGVRHSESANGDVYPVKRKPKTSLIPMRVLLVVATVLAAPGSLRTQQLSHAIFTDPPRDSAHPARMEALRVPSGRVRINGVAYLASGASRHPTVVFFHGLPGHERNVDLAHAVRRAGWNAVVVNYRGSWGSPGEFRFGNTLEDADAVLAFLRDSANARSLGVDTSRLVIAGHSMGGWVVVHTAAHDRGLRGAILISASDMARIGSMPRPKVVQYVASRLDPLASVTAESMADELASGAAKWGLDETVSGLEAIPLLVLTSDDGLTPQAEALVNAIRARGNRQVTIVHQPTDHLWSDKRIALQTSIVEWLERLPTGVR